jgi:putative two-component system response regulator
VSSEAAVTDGFDTLEIMRCFQSSKSLDDILTIFQEEKVRLVTRFFDHLDDFIAIRNKYATPK